jgi:DNA-binding IclR family transcriptional regulator
VPGAQIIGRAFEILRLVAYSGPAGGRLKDLADAANVSRPTVHRILQAMMRERAVVQDNATRRYHLGPLTFELGLTAPHYSGTLQACRPTLERLAEETGDTIYLVTRSGFDVICIDRKEGSFPIRTYTLAVGDRRPLGVGAAGLALLAALDPPLLDAFIAQHRGKLDRYGMLTVEEVRDGVMAARAQGYALSMEKLTKGVSGIGMAVPARPGPPYLGVSIASITERVHGERLPLLVKVLGRHVAELAKTLHT